MQHPEIKIKHLSKTYFKHISDALDPHKAPDSISSEDKKVLCDINLSFETGESTGIIGENGAGKSTLLSILAGISRQTEGDILIKGKVTAIMTLGLGLREDLTGRENIYIDGEIQGKTQKEIDLIIDDIINFAELGHFIDKPIKTYSTGMKSRLAFSMLVNIEPEILIIDEALSAGDVFFATKATNKIKEICKKGKIVIIVSHSMGTIETMCNRCIWLEKGQIKLDGKPSDVTKAYLEQIRKEDEQILITHYKNEKNYSSVHSAYEIKALKLTGNERDNAQNVFYTFDKLAIEIDIKMRQRQQDQDSTLNLKVERIDGLLISEENISLSQLFEEHQSDLISIVYSLEPIILNRGFYLLDISLKEHNEISNHYIRFFEVKNNIITTGGCPLFQYPITIHLTNEEFETCSDSTELITG